MTKPKLEGSIGVNADGELNIVEKGSPRQRPTIIDEEEDGDDPFLEDDADLELDDDEEDD